ncbi:MAG: protein translocase subunit SecD [Alphaproteobacteria bacterium]|nr:protein translocase subunit SecD [Alphaproteobacteria bacterium]
MLHFAKWKIALIAAVCALSVLFCLPNLLPQSVLAKLPKDFSSRQIVLGLDLQGGSHLLLEVDVKTVVVERLNALVDGARTQLRQDRVAYTNLGVAGDSITLQLREAGDAEKARAVIRALDPDLELQTNGAVVTARMTEKGLRDRKRAAIEQSIEIVRRRIDETGTREPTIQRQGDDRILVQLPGVDDPERIKNLLGKTAKMAFRLVDTTVSEADIAAGRAPPGSDILPSEESGSRRGQPGGRYAVQKRVMVSGDTLTDSQPTFQNGEPVVSFRFDSVGARRFGEATRQNVGKPFAIVLDGKVISAPVIREAILGGSGIISGSFTTQSAQDLALLLRAGALPAPLNIIEERTVGPGLGQDSIEAGKWATALGAVLVVGFMILCYSLFGVFANIALAVNVLMLLAVMSVLQATLTLPGIAGIVLTMGMSVDANVLIYERIREELRNGRSVLPAIEEGFKRAWGTIMDSNLTSLFAAILLYIFGTGPVRGFAVTLGIGIVASMFTAGMVTRLLVVLWLGGRRPQSLPI